jgi:hypothetical protein
MLVAFTKGKHVKPEATRPKAPTQKLISERYQMFREQLASLMKVIDHLKELPIYGYGAAQMGMLNEDMAKAAGAKPVSIDLTGAPARTQWG